MVVECTSPDDLIAVLHEGMKNWKSGSHELNKDSSRSHSILTVYLISEQIADDGHIFKLLSCAKAIWSNERDE